MLACSFCGKSEAEVAKLAAGPNVYICDECVAKASAIMRDEERPIGGRRKLFRRLLIALRRAYDRLQFTGSHTAPTLPVA